MNDECKHPKLEEIRIYHVEGFDKEVQKVIRVLMLFRCLSCSKTFERKGEQFIEKLEI